MKKQWIKLLGGDLILIPLDGNHRLTVMSTYFYEMDFGTTMKETNNVFNSSLRLDNKSPAWTQAPVECFEYNVKDKDIVTSGEVTNKFQQLCNQKSKIIETESRAKNKSAFKNMLVNLTYNYEKKINSSENQYKEHGGQNGLTEKYLDVKPRSNSIISQHRQLICEMVWTEYTTNGTYGIDSLTKFLTGRKKTHADIKKILEEKTKVHTSVSFCHSGKGVANNKRANIVLPLDMQATAEFSVNTMLTKKSADKVKTFFYGTQTDYKQNDFDYGKLHDVTSVEWTQLMVYYANRFSQILFNQRIDDDVKNWKVHKTISKLKTYIVHFFYHDMMEILTTFGPNPEIPKTTYTNCTVIRTFVYSATKNIPFIHGYINMYIKYLASFINAKREDDITNTAELTALYNDLFPNMPDVNARGGYDNDIDLETFRIDEKYNIRNILTNCILNEKYNWNEPESTTSDQKFTWSHTFNLDHLFDMPLPETLILPPIPKKLAVTIQHTKPPSRAIKATPANTTTMDERQEIYTTNLVFHITNMQKRTSDLRDFILSVPSSCTEQALNDFKTQASLQIQEILTKSLPIKPEQKKSKRKREQMESSSDHNDSDDDSNNEREFRSDDEV
jgi:hypothetical protein